jgi:hypothetical protein
MANRRAKTSLVTKVCHSHTSPLPTPSTHSPECCLVSNLPSPSPTSLLPYLSSNPTPPLIALSYSLTDTHPQPSYTPALHQAFKRDIFPFVLPLYYHQRPWMHILHPVFPLSPHSPFHSVPTSPPYLAPLRPSAPHHPSLRAKMA